MHTSDGDGAETVVIGLSQVASHRVLVERHDDVAAGADALGRLDHPRVQQVRQDNVAVEDLGTVLVADPQRVGEATGNDQHGRLALALEQGVRRHRGAQPDRPNPVGRDGLARRHAQEPADPRDDGVLVRAGILRQQLAGDQAAVGLPRDDVGEGPAPVNPEFNAPLHLPDPAWHDNRGAQPGLISR